MKQSVFFRKLEGFNPNYSGVDTVLITVFFLTSKEHFITEVPQGFIT